MAKQKIIMVFSSNSLVTFINLMTSDPEILAEGDFKMHNKWGWDHKFNLRIHPSCDEFQRVMFIAAC
jgi:hypothetical protein